MQLIKGLKLFSRYPRWSSWAALSAGVVLLTLWAAQDRGLSVRQLAGLMVVCLGLAGACIGILSCE